jgi:hypothetical protein
MEQVRVTPRRVLVYADGHLAGVSEAAAAPREPILARRLAREVS